MKKLPLTCNNRFAEDQIDADPKDTFSEIVAQLAARRFGVRRQNLVSCAGLIPVVALAEQGGLSGLPDDLVRFTDERSRAGWANPTPKLTSIVARPGRLAFVEQFAGGGVEVLRCPVGLHGPGR